MENELKDITKKSGLVFIGKLFGVCLGFLFNLIAARYIGAEIYGQFVYVYTMILFLPKIMKLGLDQGLVSFIPKLEAQDKFTERNSLISFSLVLTFFLGFIVILLLVFNSELIAKIVLNNSNLSGLVKIMAPLILFLTPIQISKGVFRGVNKIKYFIIGKNILFSILKLILLIFLSILGYKLYGLIISFYFSFFIIVFYLINQIKKLDLFGKIKS